MANITFELNAEQLDILKSKSRLYSQVSKVLSKSYFKIDKDQMIFLLRGQSGVLSTVIPVDISDITEPVYFSVDYIKWNTALQKFSDADTVIFTFTGNTIKICTSLKSDVIILGISTYASDSQEAFVIDEFISQKKNEIITSGSMLDLNSDIVSAFQLANTLFSSQGRSNAIGLGKNDVVYADKAVILKSHLDNSLSDSLFKNLSDDEEYIYIHTAMVDLISTMFQTGSQLWFSEDYGIIYWSDDTTEIVIASDDRDTCLPTEEDWESIKPADIDMSISLTLNDLQAALSFFDGFYEGSVWKPITFDIKAGSETSLRYKSATTDIAKELVGATGPTDGYFLLASDILEKLLSKVKERIRDNNTEVLVNYDDDSLGVYIKITDKYEFVLSKLVDNDED